MNISGTRRPTADAYQIPEAPNNQTTRRSAGIAFLKEKINKLTVLDPLTPPRPASAAESLVVASTPNEFSPARVVNGSSTKLTKDGLKEHVNKRNVTSNTRDIIERPGDAVEKRTQTSHPDSFSAPTQRATRSHESATLDTKALSIAEPSSKHLSSSIPLQEEPINKRNVTSNTREIIERPGNAEEQRTEKPALADDRRDDDDEHGATQIASDESYARLLQEKEDASEVLRSEERPRDRGPQGEPLPKYRKSEAGSSTGLTEKLHGIIAGESASDVVPIGGTTSEVHIPAHEHYVELLKSMYAIKLLGPEKYRENSMYKGQGSKLINFLRREQDNETIKLRLDQITNTIREDNDREELIAILNECMENLEETRETPPVEGVVPNVQAPGIQVSPISSSRKIEEDQSESNEQETQSDSKEQSESEASEIEEDRSESEEQEELGNPLAGTIDVLDDLGVLPYPESEEEEIDTRSGLDSMDIDPSPRSPGNGGNGAPSPGRSTQRDQQILRDAQSQGGAGTARGSSRVP